MIHFLVLVSSLHLNPDSLQSHRRDTTYEQYIEIADSLFSISDFRTAGRYYESALYVRPGDAYSSNQIDVSREKMGCWSDPEPARQKIIKKADEYFDAENYERAGQLYQRALSIKPGDVYVQERLAECNKRPMELLYENNISLGDSAFAAGDYALAKQYYHQALSVKPDEAHATKQVMLCEMYIQDIHDKEQTKVWIERYTSAGDQDYTLAKYQSAKEYYLKALMHSNDKNPYVQYQLGVIDRKLQGIDSPDKEKLEYENLLSKADEYFQAGQYDVALNLYTRLITVVKPGDSFLEERIKACDEKLKD